ncbi:GNAT family N-acetyltransferase [Thermococcus prieurii]
MAEVVKSAYVTEEYENKGRTIVVLRGPAMIPLDIETFVDTLDEWLGEFSDPKNEILEAVYNALAKGFILLAYEEGELAGIAVVSRICFETFFPRYHLSYIATKPEFRGRGIGTMLLEKVKEVTGGDFSLHVDVKNTNAIRLYEKVGMKKKYYRMLYRGGTTE